MEAFIYFASIAGNSSEIQSTPPLQIVLQQRLTRGVWEPQLFNKMIRPLQQGGGVDELENAPGPPVRYSAKGIIP